MTDRDLSTLRAGEVLGGHFALPGTGWNVPGILSWAEGGAKLELIEGCPEWPAELGGDDYTVHGVAGSTEVTLLGAWTQGRAMGTARKVSCNALALHGQVMPDDLWTDAFYSTAHLSEWRADNGLEYEPPSESQAGSPDELVVRAGFPPREELVLPNAEGWFEGIRETYVAFSANWEVRTWQQLAVKPAGADTARALHRRYAEPLWALTSFVADAPDSITHEVLLNKPEARQVEIWRERPRVSPREWHPGRPFVASAEDFDDLPSAIRAWWEIHEQVWPALGVFAESITEGRRYSPSRLITVWSALEAYGRERHKTRDLRELRRYCGVSSQVIGATNKRLDLIGAVRGYWAHLKADEQRRQAKKPMTREVFDEELLHCIRVAAALLQACLLRDLGFSATRAEELLTRHYSNWPLPR